MIRRPRRPRRPAADLVAGWLATNPRYLASLGRPVPWVVFHARHTVMGRTVTAISRGWLPGDSGPAGACRRCPTCRAESGQCLVIAPFDLAARETVDYAPVDHLAGAGVRGGPSR